MKFALPPKSTKNNMILMSPMKSISDIRSVQPSPFKKHLDSSPISNKLSIRESTFYLDSVKSSHKEGISCATVIKGYLATGSYDSTIKIWDMHTFELVKTLKGHRLWITCLASTGFGTQVSAKDMSATDSYVIEAILDESIDRRVSGDFENSLLISGSLDYDIRVWDISGDESSIGCLRGHYQMITCVKTFKYAKNLLVSGSRDKNIRFWDIKTRQCVFTKIEHTDWVTCLEVFQSKTIMASAGSDKSILIWKLLFTDDDVLQKCVLKFRLSQAHEGAIHTLASSENENFLISGGEDGAVKVWDIERGSCNREICTQKKAPLFKVVYLKDLVVDTVRYPPKKFLSCMENEQRVISECVIGSGTNGDLHVWDISTGEEILVCENGHQFKEDKFPFGDIVKLNKEVKYWKGLLSQEYNMVTVANGEGVFHLWKF